MTWFPATWGELIPLDDKVTLSTVVGLFKLSRSEADEEGDSPKQRKPEELHHMTSVSPLALIQWHEQRLGKEIAKGKEKKRKNPHSHNEKGRY